MLAWRWYMSSLQKTHFLLRLLCFRNFAGLLQVALLGTCAPLKFHTSYNLEWQVHGASAAPAPHRTVADGL